jgi:hypothetical protein
VGENVLRILSHQSKERNIHGGISLSGKGKFKTGR